MPDEEPAPASPSHAPSAQSPGTAPPPVGTGLPMAWQPFTIRGVAAFARAPLRRLLIVQALIAFAAAIALAWFLYHAWFPSVLEAIRRLPDEGVIEGQRLVSGSAGFMMQVDGRHLGFVVDTGGDNRATLTSDVRVEFLVHGLRICSLLGCWPLPYPAGWRIQFNRPELEPLWGAWQPIILGLEILIAPCLLLLTWAALATCYCPFVWLIGYFNDRHLTLAGSWRLAGASLMPGALIMIAAILAYGAGALDLLRMLVVTTFHLLVPWPYLILAPLTLPLIPRTQRPSANPFGSATA
ncbi:MAG TPA: hypothetical protein VNO52_17865 [Methylomirabilota bacterium]|nr:hypothetical protein [Methylomirabilota bacterium]